MNAGDKEILDHFVRTREATLKLFDRVPPDWFDRTRALGRSLFVRHGLVKARGSIPTQLSFR